MRSAARRPHRRGAAAFVGSGIVAGRSPASCFGFRRPHPRRRPAARAPAHRRRCSCARARPASRVERTRHPDADQRRTSDAIVTLRIRQRRDRPRRRLSWPRSGSTTPSATGRASSSAASRAGRRAREVALRGALAPARARTTSAPSGCRCATRSASPTAPPRSSGDRRPRRAARSRTRSRTDRRPAAASGRRASIPHMVALHGEDDVTIREYRDGDDLRRIHWPATARTGDLMVRQEDRPAQRRAVVVLDPRAVGHGGLRAQQLVRVGVTAAASRHRPPRRRRVCRAPAHRRRRAPTTACTTTRPSRTRSSRWPGSALGRRGRPAGRAARRQRAHLAGRARRLRRRPGRRRRRPHPVAALRQPGSAGAAMVVDPRGVRRPHPQAGPPTPRRAEATLATLQSSGWMTTPVDARTTPALAWAAVVGGQVVGAR